MRCAIGTRSNSTRRSLCTILAFLFILSLGEPAFAQTPEPSPRLVGVGTAGGRSYLSNSNGTLGFVVSNPTSKDLDARVLSFFDDSSFKQYGRDVWVPAKSSLRSWFCIGPPARQPVFGSVELKSLLYARAGNDDSLIRSAVGQPLQSDLIPYEKRDPITTVMLDLDVTDGSENVTSVRDVARAEELQELVRVFRQTCGLSSKLNAVRQRFLPPIPEALEGVDQFVLGSDRIAEDANGQRALRGWLERGGHLWIPLDLLKKETVSALLGDILDLQEVDRTSVTSLHFQAGSAAAYVPEAGIREIEQPVTFVRVLAPDQRIFYTIDGWPAASSAAVGRGSVIFTMLGAGGWTRPRVKTDPASKFPEFPQMPMPTAPFQYVADELQGRQERPPISAKLLASYVNDQISYTVVNRGLILSVFGLFFLGLVAFVVFLAKKGVLEHLGWLAPAMALATAASFVGIGASARSAVPPTLAVVQIVDAMSGADVAQASGYLGVFEPDSISGSIGAQNGGNFDLDLSGLEGRMHSRVQTDSDRWHWENLELPTGVRVGPFKYAIPAPDPMGATIRFGPDGVEGSVHSGPFSQLEDLLLVTPGPHALPVVLQADGSIQANGADGLPSGQLISSGLLNDRQRTRQSLYEQLLAEPAPRFLSSRNLILAWANPVDMHFSVTKDARMTGAALLIIPARFEQTPPATQVTVPAAVVDCQRVGPEGHLLPPAAESRTGANVRLRFQVPAEVLPMTVQSARLEFKLRAPLRDVTVRGFANGAAVPLRRLTSPFGIERIDISDPRLLQLDKNGLLFVEIDVGGVSSESTGDLWHLDWVGLEVRGRTAARR
jgi:hypothetical protein